MGSIEEVIVELRHVVAAKSGVNWRLNDFQNNRQGAICIRCTFSLRTIEDLHRIRLCKNRVHVDLHVPILSDARKLNTALIKRSTCQNIKYLGLMIGAEVDVIYETCEFTT